MFVEIDNLFYDAENLEGVDDWRDLDIWDREASLHDKDLREYSRSTDLKEVCDFYDLDYQSVLDYIT